MSNVVMSKEDLRQAQKVMLYIMKAIHRVCVKHNIKYWLDYGTLLGAIRHQGFIPWDDDMDICMMREDYDRFCEIAPKELGEEFFLQTPESDDTFLSVYAKLRLNGTIWLERDAKISKVSHTGFFIDIFPMDPMPTQRFRQLVTAFIYDQVMNGVRDYHVLGRGSESFGRTFVKRLIAPFLSVKQIQRSQKKVIQRLQRYKNCSQYISKICMDCKRDICNRAVLEDVILHRFEDAEFYIPMNYETRLRALFGDYMQLPPEDKRYNKHQIVKFDFGKYKDL